MSFQSQFALFAGGFFLCLAIMLPFITKWNDTVSNPVIHSNLHASGGPKPMNSMPKSSVPLTNRSKQSKGSWIAYFAPFYAIGVCVYVLYIIYRLITKQHQNTATMAKRNISNREKKRQMLFSRNELGVLEQKLTASEKAVDEILRKACIAMKEVYKNEMNNEDESSLSSDLDAISDAEDPKLSRITELASTSSANNDSHQDSSSTSEGRDPLHHRKMHHRLKKHVVNSKHDSTSSDETETGLTHVELQNTDASSFLRSSESEEISTSVTFSDAETDSPRLFPNEENSSRKHAALNNPEKLNENITTIEKKSFSGENVEHFADSTSITKTPVVHKLKNEQFQREKDKFMQTTKQVLNAMGEIRDLINDHKNTH